VILLSSEESRFRVIDGNRKQMNENEMERRELVLKIVRHFTIQNVV
jgi:hypothetical protein